MEYVNDEGVLVTMESKSCRAFGPRWHSVDFAAASVNLLYNCSLHVWCMVTVVIYFPPTVLWYR